MNLLFEIFIFFTKSIKVQQNFTSFTFNLSIYVVQSTTDATQLTIPLIKHCLIDFVELWAEFLISIFVVFYKIVGKLVCFMLTKLSLLENCVLRKLGNFWNFFD